MGRTHHQAAIVFLLLAGCAQQPAQRPSVKPKLVLFAWDRAEDLTFLEPGEAEVVAWMSTLKLRGDGITFHPRRLPLRLPSHLEAQPIVRLESEGFALPAYDQVIPRLAESSVVDSRRGRVPLLLDFDARESERDWYRGLLRELAKDSARPVGITALASWCLTTPFFAPERPTLLTVIPMLYDMGPRQNALYTRLYRQKDLTPACRGTIGLATDQIPAWRPPAQTIYLFHHQRWTREAFDEACRKLQACSSSPAL